MNKKENNFAFIDSNNLNLSIKDCGWELDFAKFYIYLNQKMGSGAFLISKKSNPSTRINSVRGRELIKN